MNELHGPKMSYAWAMPNRKTFVIAPITRFVERWLSCKSTIVDPFAGNAEFGTLTNDIDPETSAIYHEDALEFLKQIPDSCTDAVLLDPPYSIHQASLKYRCPVDKFVVSPTNKRYWSCIAQELSRILRIGGIALSFGWTCQGLGKKNGCRKDEILVVAHGGGRNATICVAETKIHDPFGKGMSNDQVDSHDNRNTRGAGLSL